MAIEACRIALKYMTPVVYLSDAFLATGSEPWSVPDLADLPDIRVPNATDAGDLPPVPARPGDARPTVGRPGHARPRAPHRRPREGRHHRQRQLRPGQPPPDAAVRQAKVAGIANDIPPLEVYGPERGDLLILGWGSTYGAIRSAVERLQARGKPVAHAHLRHLNPFPANTEDVLRRYRQVLIPEVNLGQLLMLIRARFLVDAVGYNQVRGKPFPIAEIVDRGRAPAGGGRMTTEPTDAAGPAAR